MTWTELVLGMMWNFTGVAIFVAVAASIAGLIIAIISVVFPAEDHYSKEEEKKAFTTLWLGRAKILGGIALVSSLIGCIPSVDDLWKIRIGMIKLELTSPETLSQAKETIERIGVKLECKYLGGQNCKDGVLVEEKKEEKKEQK